MIVSAEMARQVAARAGSRCEYCRMHQALQGATFHVEHIIPSARGGGDDPQNFAWACPACNLHKSDKTHSEDPESGGLVRLFHPRNDGWNDHFLWVGFALVGRTPVGRATAHALDLNHERRVRIREAEHLFGLFAGAAPT
jgi:hypothetical protein